jgi:hypothetical protein
MRLIGLYAVVAAAASVVLAPLLALAYFATSEGAEELEAGTVSAWAEPVRDAAGGLLTFASADRVYSTYLQALAVLVPAILLCAWATRRLRPRDVGTGERWGWRLALAGYLLVSLGTVTVGAFLVVTTPASTAVNAAFLALLLPGILVGTVGSTVLGVALLRAGYRPGLTPWLLALAIPLWLTGSIVLGHNSIGLVPLLVAWAATGWRLLRADARRAVTGS